MILIDREKIRQLCEQLKTASPFESARIAREILKLVTT